MSIMCQSRYDGSEKATTSKDRVYRPLGAQISDCSSLTPDVAVVPCQETGAVRECYRR